MEKFAENEEQNTPVTLHTLLVNLFIHIPKDANI